MCLGDKKESKMHIQFMNPQNSTFHNYRMAREHCAT